MTTTLNSAPSIAIEEGETPVSPQFADTAVGRAEASVSKNMLLSNIVWMLLGNVAYGFSQWALLVALAKLGTIEMVGHFSLAVALALPVFMFSSLTLRSLQVTDAMRSYRFFEYGALRMFTAILSVAFIIVASVASRYSPVLLISTALIAAAKAAEYISDILYGLLQQEEAMSGIAISMILRSLLSVVGFGVTVYLTHSLVWASASLFFCSIAVLGGYDIPKAVSSRKTLIADEIHNFSRYCSSLRNKKNVERLGRLALTGLPMGFALMVVSLNLSIPRYFIQHYLGMAELGIFSAIATLLASGSVAINAIGQAAAPRMAKAFAMRENRKFSLLLLGLISASLGMGILGLLGSIFFGKQAMTLIYRPEYSTRQDLLIWLMASSGLYYLGSILGYAVTAVRCYGPQLPLFVAAAVTTATGCVCLIPKMGLRGAAAAIFLSAVVQCLGSIFLLYRATRKAKSQPVLVLRAS